MTDAISFSHHTSSGVDAGKNTFGDFVFKPVKGFDTTQVIIYGCVAFGLYLIAKRKRWV